MGTGSQISKPFALAMKRAKWLGDAAATLKQAITDNNEEAFNQTYNETMNALHWKFKTAKQLTLPLRENHHPHSINQLKLFAA
jgi:hypothetical protein